MLEEQKGDLEQAEEHLKEALRMERSVHGGADHLKVADILHELGMLLKQKGDLEYAEEHLKEQHWAGMVLKQQGDLEQAEEHLKEPLRTCGRCTRFAYAGHVAQAEKRMGASRGAPDGGGEDDEVRLWWCRPCGRCARFAYAGHVAQAERRPGASRGAPEGGAEDEEVRLCHAGADHAEIAVTLHELGMVLKHLKEARRMKQSVYGVATIKVDISLPSGKWSCFSMSCFPNMLVQELKAAAQQQFQGCFLRLIAKLGGSGPKMD